MNIIIDIVTNKCLYLCLGLWFIIQLSKVIILINTLLNEAVPLLATLLVVPPKTLDILEEIDREETQFLTTLEKWLKEFDKLVSGFQIAFERTGQKVDTISWEKAFKLYDTFGFPIEMTVELATEVKRKDSNQSI